MNGKDPSTLKQMGVSHAYPLSAEGHPVTSLASIQLSTTLPYSPPSPARLHSMQQLQQPQHQYQYQHQTRHDHQQYQYQTLQPPLQHSQVHIEPQLQTQQSALIQVQQPMEQKDDTYIPSKHQRLPTSSSSIAPAATPAYPTYANQGVVITRDSSIGQLPVVIPSTQATPNEMRSNVMYVSHPESSGSPQQSHPRPQYSRYLEHSYEEQQQRQYEQYEQQSRYYREAATMHANMQEKQHSEKARRYRRSTHSGSYNDTTPSWPQQQQHPHQLQAQRSLNLGSLPSNRFLVARDQLPTAPSPPVFSATQPEPTYFKNIAAQPVLNFGDSSFNVANTSGSIQTSGAGKSRRSSESCVAQPNRRSGHSPYSTSSPVITEKIAKPLTENQGPIAQLPLVGDSNRDHTVASLVRSNSDSNWQSSGGPTISKSTPKASQNRAYSRQVTLSSIPPNEGVPPMPGKMTSKTGKVHIQLTFDKPFFNAGGELSGRLEIQCSSSSSIMFADIIIELLGYEALTKDHPSLKIFHKTVLRLQDARHPSQAVQENIDPDSAGYWAARKGRTIFPFRLNIQDTLPSSYDSKLGQVRYVTSAIARMKTNQQKEIVNHSREAFIYESWTTDDVIKARKKSVKADTSKRLFMGGEGSLEMYAELTRTMVSSGGIVYVNVGVKNLTKRKVMGIKLTLCRHVTVPNKDLSANTQVSVPVNRDQDNVKNYCEIIYKGEDYAFDNDDPRMVVLPIYIPSGVYSLRNATYLHVQFYVQVSLMTSMNKALTVELPIYIAHASSWSDPPPRIPRDFAFPTHEHDPVKKNITGVFSKKKVAPLQSGGSSSSLKKSPGICDSGSNTRDQYSAPSSQINTPTFPQGNARDGACTHPIARRSSPKDPDSPTSVLDFSQVKNLFVVNPDAASIRGTSDTASLMPPPTNLGVCSAPSPRVLQTGSAVPITTSLPSSMSTLLKLSDQPAPKPLKETEPTSHNLDSERDSDMGHPRDPSQVNSVKKEQEKPRSRKLGLKRTQAKLSIVIPNQSPNNLSLKQVSPISPRKRPTNPRSEGSTNTESPGNISSGESKSPGGATLLSCNSSGSSLGSFKQVLDSISRKSSVGSTRVMAVSPGPMPTNCKSLKMTKCFSEASPPALSPRTVDVLESTPFSGSSHMHTEQTPTERQPDHLRVMPDPKLHGETPMAEEKGSEGYSDSSGNGSRTPTSSSSVNRIATDQSSPITPNSFTKPWELQRNFSSSSISSSLLSSYEGIQTAKGIRDEYYLGKNGQNRRRSSDSFEIRIAPPQTGDPNMVDSGMYDIHEHESDKSDTNSPALLSGEDNQPQQQKICSEMSQLVALVQDMSDNIQSHDVDPLQVGSTQSSWDLGQYEVVMSENDYTNRNQGRLSAPQPENNQQLSPHTQATSTQAILIHGGTPIPLSQGPEGQQVCDDQLLQNQDAAPHQFLQFQITSPLSNSDYERVTFPQPYTPEAQKNLEAQGVHPSFPTASLTGRPLSQIISPIEGTRAHLHPESSMVSQIASSTQREYLAEQDQRRAERSPTEISADPSIPISDPSRTYQSSATTTISEPIVPTSFLNSSETEQPGVTPRNGRENRHVSGGATLMEQTCNPTVSVTANTQLYSGSQSCPGQLGPQYSTPQHRLTANTSAHEASVAGRDIKDKRCDKQRYAQVAETSQSPVGVYEEEISFIVPKMQLLSSQHMLPHETNLYDPRLYSSQARNAENDQAPYQPCTQYTPESRLPEGTQFNKQRTDHPSAAFNFHDTSDHDLKSQMSIASTYGAHPTTATPPIPERRWIRQSALPVRPITSYTEPLLNHVETSAPVISQANSCSNVRFLGTQPQNTQLQDTQPQVTQSQDTQSPEVGEIRNCTRFAASDALPFYIHHNQH
ncbi:hypothetical protein BGX21_002578 [Mortierella sp. AD011]|nr:hypothetical protein BGX20_005317 [Mortierella sp. AD010]KAF9401145.1 hypothetical protein BGX21_002578 [Mortierella sp. AD011]